MAFVAVPLILPIGYATVLRIVADLPILPGAEENGGFAQARMRFSDFQPIRTVR